jgi:hypothetical protein
LIRGENRIEVDLEKAINEEICGNFTENIECAVTKIKKLYPKEKWGDWFTR